MRIHPIIAKVLVGAAFGLQVWTLTEVIHLKIKVAVILNQLHINPFEVAQEKPNINENEQ